MNSTQASNRLWVLHRHCTRVEQRLILAIRNLAGGSEQCAEGARILDAMQLDAQGLWSFVQLTRQLVHGGNGVTLNGPLSGFATEDEMSIVATLHRFFHGRAARDDDVPCDPVQPSLHEAFTTCVQALRRAGVAMSPRKFLLTQPRHLEAEPGQAHWRSVPGYQRHPVRIAGIARLTPNMLRMGLQGEGLRGMHRGKAAQWIKLFAPVGAVQPQGRAYTIRHCDTQAGTLEIDFARHGTAGSQAHWAEHTARVGDTVEIAGPRGGYTLSERHAWMLLAGDMTAIPSMASLIEAAPPEVQIRALLSLRDPQDALALPRPPNVSVVSANDAAADDGSLLRLLEAQPIPQRDPGLIWLGAEASVAQQARAFLGQAYPSSRVQSHCVGYWKRGVRDHKDIAAG